MKARVLRIVLLVVSAALLAYGILGERHTIWSRPGGEAREISGFGLTEAATVDAVMLKEGKLYEKHRAPQKDEGGAKETPSKPACPT
jgi:hypothetical protein